MKFEQFRKKHSVPQNLFWRNAVTIISARRSCAAADHPRAPRCETRAASPNGIMPPASCYRHPATIASSSPSYLRPRGQSRASASLSNSNSGAPAPPFHLIPFSSWLMAHMAWVPHGVDAAQVLDSRRRWPVVDAAARRELRGHHRLDSRPPGRWRPRSQQRQRSPQRIARISSGRGGVVLSVRQTGASFKNQHEISCCTYVGSHL